MEISQNREIQVFIIEGTPKIKAMHENRFIPWVKDSRKKSLIIYKLTVFRKATAF